MCGFGEVAGWREFGGFGEGGEGQAEGEDGPGGDGGGCAVGCGGGGGGVSWVLLGGRAPVGWGGQKMALQE